MAVVHCHNTNGVVLRLYEEIAGPLGIKEYRPKRGAPTVTLHPGHNEVDDAFWGAWAEANKASELLTSAVLHVDKPKTGAPK